MTRDIILHHISMLTLSRQEVFICASLFVAPMIDQEKFGPFLFRQLVHKSSSQESFSL